MNPHKASFWVAVGATALLANFALELAAAKAPKVMGLQWFTNFTHRGGAQ